MILLPPRTVVLESPYRGNEHHTIEQHRVYLDHCITDCRLRKEAAYASHFGLLGDDDDEIDREEGIRMGWAIGDLLDYVVVYSDLFVTPGMTRSIDHYKSIGKDIHWRKLDARLVKSILEM